MSEIVLSANLTQEIFSKLALFFTAAQQVSDSSPTRLAIGIHQGSLTTHDDSGLVSGDVFPFNFTDASFSIGKLDVSTWPNVSVDAIQPTSQCTDHQSSQPEQSAPEIEHELASESAPRVKSEAKPYGSNCSVPSTTTYSLSPAQPGISVSLDSGPPLGTKECKSVESEPAAKTSSPAKSFRNSCKTPTESCKTPAKSCKMPTESCKTPVWRRVERVVLTTWNVLWISVMIFGANYRRGTFAYRACKFVLGENRAERWAEEMEDPRDFIGVFPWIALCWSKYFGYVRNWISAKWRTCVGGKNEVADRNFVDVSTAVEVANEVDEKESGDSDVQDDAESWLLI